MLPYFRYCYSVPVPYNILFIIWVLLSVVVPSLLSISIKNGPTISSNLGETMRDPNDQIFADHSSNSYYDLSSTASPPIPPLFSSQSVPVITDNGIAIRNITLTEDQQRLLRFSSNHLLGPGPSNTLPNHTKERTKRTKKQKLSTVSPDISKFSIDISTPATVTDTNFLLFEREPTTPTLIERFLLPTNNFTSFNNQSSPNLEPTTIWFHINKENSTLFSDALAENVTSNINDYANLIDISDSFHMKPYSENGSHFLEINFTQISTYGGYTVNCLDLQFNVKISIDNITKNPFLLDNLLPGHEYNCNFSVTNGTRTYRQVAKEFTDPIVPLISNQNDISLVIKQHSVTLIGRKSSGALHDDFIINCNQIIESNEITVSRDMEPMKCQGQWNDSSSTDDVIFHVTNMNPGRIYNISIIPIRFNRTGRAYNALVVTKPSQPYDFTLRNIFIDDGSKSELEWKLSNTSGYDQFLVKYRSVNSINFTEVSTVDTHTILNATLTPGRKYEFSIWAVKNGTLSKPLNVSVIIKPLPPENFTIFAVTDLHNPGFVVEVKTLPSSIQDTCILHYSPTSTIVPLLSQTAPVTVPVLNDTCTWSNLPLVPGTSYRFNVITSSDGGSHVLSVSGPPPKSSTESGSSSSSVSPVIEHSDPLYKPAELILPIFNYRLYALSVLPTEGAVEVSWDSKTLEQHWLKMVGYQGTLNITVLEDNQITASANPLLSGKIILNKLVTGKCYTLFMYSIVNGVASKEKMRYPIRTLPGPVNLSITNITSNSAKIISGPTIHTIDQSCRWILLVSGLAPDKAYFNKTVYPKENFEILNDLTPFSTYSVSTYYSCGDYRREQCGASTGSVKNLSFTTTEGTPSSIQSLMVDLLAPFKANVSWLPPDRPNGNIVDYVLSIRSNREGAWNYTIPYTRTYHMLDNLTGGNMYTVDVRARTRAGIGNSFCIAEGGWCDRASFETFIWAPPKPVGRVEILSNTVRETDFTISYNLSMFSSKHGYLIAYAILVAEGNSPLDTVGNLSWYDVYDTDDVWTPYIAIYKNLTTKSATFDSTPITDLIGLNRNCVKERAISGVRYCNGPLKPSTAYRVKLRAYTRQDLYTDSDYSEFVKTNADSSSTVGVAVAAVLSVAMLLAFVFGFLFFLKGRGVDPVQKCLKKERRKFFNGGSAALANGGVTCADGGATAVNESALTSGSGGNRRQRSLRERANIDGRLDRLGGCHVHASSPSFYRLPPLHTVLASANHEMSRPVRKSDFAEHVRLMSADSDFRFSEEYEDLKQVGRNQPCTAADLPCNRNKNRFTNILPYDHSRVKLIPVDDEEGTDFINASYIPGYNSPREFIATQGPLPSTRDDFWRMVVEQNCSAIVNLTRCVEKGREKCDQYWPIDNQPICYGDIEVIVMNESRFPDWTIREFKVIKEGDQPRIVRHFHFTAWPDFGVPERPQVLIKFARTFRSRQPPADSRPVVVHCSAGVGRSGTFIALDRLLQQAQHEDVVDAFGAVYEMRIERVSMVQTEQQYICIHQCLLCVLESQDGSGTGNNKENSPSSSSPSFSNTTKSSTFSSSRLQQHGVEVHQNPAFEDDEGIAESGL